MDSCKNQALAMKPMAAWWMRILLIVIAFAFLGQLSVAASERILDRATCSFGGKPLYGKVQVVESFPDVRVQAVESFPDLKVKLVSSFPDSCGEWQIVESFPHVKVQFVQNFPDIKIQYVKAFPGLVN
ncbi:MAG: hypothetical protein RML75_12230 [Cyanobacteriota bacterium SKYGB_h_bin112]|nr:hypothetical protein [Cyanobacteriota bacterium SKYGB_h_bin112]